MSNSKKKNKRAKSIPGSVKESTDTFQWTKGVRKQSQERYRAGWNQFERLGRGEFLGCCREAGVQWVREPPKAIHFQVA